MKKLLVMKPALTNPAVTKPAVTKPVVTKPVVIKLVVTRTVVARTPVIKTVVTRTLVGSRTPEEIKPAVVIRRLAGNKMPVATEIKVDSKMPHRQALLALPSQRALQDSKTQPGLMLVETPVALEVTTGTVAAEETGARIFKGTNRASSNREDRYLLKSNPRLFQGLMT